MGLRTYEEEKRSDKIDAILDAMDMLGPMLRKCRTNDQLMDSMRATSAGINRKGRLQVLNANVWHIDDVRMQMETLFELLEQFDVDLRSVYTKLVNTACDTDDSSIPPLTASQRQAIVDKATSEGADQSRTKNVEPF